jgi:AcrR family transcriptional regulator
MEDIATEAGVAKGTIYRYFEDKEELYLALLTRASGQFVRRIEAKIKGSGSARSRLEAAVGDILSYFYEQPHLLDLIQLAEVMLRPGTTFPWQQTRDELLRLVLELFEEGRIRGEFEIQDPELSALMLLGGLRSVIRFAKKARPRDLACKITAYFIHGAWERAPCHAPTEAPRALANQALASSAVRPNVTANGD